MSSLFDRLPYIALAVCVLVFAVFYAVPMAKGFTAGIETGLAQTQTGETDATTAGQ